MKKKVNYDMASYESPEGNCLRSGEIPLHNLMFITSQIENDRACLAAQAMNNTATLKGMAKQFADGDPWDQRQYELIVAAYGVSACETICKYGRNITTNNKWKW